MKEGIISNRNQLKKQIGTLSIRTKIIILVIVVSFCALLTSTYICSTMGTGILSKQVEERLTSLESSHANQFQQYIKFLLNHTETISDDYMFVNAMQEFKQAFDKLAQVNIPKEYDEKLNEYYRKEFIPQFKARGEAAPLPESLLPKTSAVRYIQYHYLANNPYPEEEKYKLLDPKDGSEYSRINAKYSDNFINIAKRFGYYDLYLIDMQGNIVYLLSNKADIGTNLFQGPVSDSNLFTAYKACRQSNSNTYVKVVDFQPYFFSYNQPTGFVASPIFHDSRMIGVLAFQLPVHQIDEIFNHSKDWQGQGLGESGEVYLVGEDALLRSNSRFLIENLDKFLETLRNSGTPERIIQKISAFKTTVSILPAKSEGIQQALKGKKVAFRNRDYRGVEVFGVYEPIDFNGLPWAIAAKMDVKEVYKTHEYFQQQVLIVAGLLMVVVTLVAIGTARIFVRPIERLIATTQQVEAGDKDAMVVAGTDDEFNDLARIFNKTIYNLRYEIQEQEQQGVENQELIKKLVPLRIAKRLKAGEDPIADPVSNATVVFTDFHHFITGSVLMKIRGSKIRDSITGFSNPAKTMNQVDLAFAPALEQAQLIRQRQVSPIELVEIYLKRIQRFNPQLGCYFTVMGEQALAEAKVKTEMLGQDDLPRFFGVPISIKDLHAVTGVPCTYGTPALINNVPTQDDVIVSRIRQAGFIILGKTATSELGSTPYTEPTGFPPARNPWNLDYTPGGSSGGAAAAVAAGLCAIAQGSDGGGSIRTPAACCGLVGLKPARGRISFAPVGDRLSGLGTLGCLSRTVADAAAFLDVVSGYVTGDPYWLPPPDPSFLAATQTELGSLRIAFSTTIPPLGEADPVCQQAVQETVQLLAQLGHTVEPGCPDFSGLVEPFTIVWQSGVAASGIPKEALEPLNRWLLEQTVSAGEYLRAVAQIQVIARRIVAFFDSVDVLVLPAFLQPTIQVGEWASLNPEEAVQKIIQWIAPSPPFNATGQPVIALPTGFAPNGLPLGIQLVGRPAAEGTLIALAAQLEAAKPWIHHRASIYNS